MSNNTQVLSSNSNILEPRKRGQKIAPSEIDKLIGMRIRIARNISGKRQDELARHLGLTLQQTQKYENGKNKISVNVLTQVAAYFNIPISYFIPNTIGSDQENTQNAIASLSYINANSDHKIAEDWKPIGEQEQPKEQKEIILKIMETIVKLEDIDKQKEVLKYIKELEKQ